MISVQILSWTCLIVVGKGTDKRNRGAARGFRELTQQQSDDCASSINLLTKE